MSDLRLGEWITDYPPPDEQMWGVIIRRADGTPDEMWAANARAAWGTEVTAWMAHYLPRWPVVIDRLFRPSLPDPSPFPRFSIWRGWLHRRH